MGPKISQEVLGFLIDEETPVPNAPESVVQTQTLNLANLVTIQRLSRLVDTTLSARDKMVIDSYSNLVVRMPARDYGTTEFDMSAQRKTALIEAGKQAMQAYYLAQEHPAAHDVSFGLDDEQTESQIIINRIASKILR